MSVKVSGKVKSSSRIFFHFLLLSGAGWLCDFTSFTVLVKLCHAPGFVANFVSSYVGVTVVWFTSLRAVFGHRGSARGRFLFVYWGYQFISILGYSQCLHLVVSALETSALPEQLLRQAAITAKIIVTPFNLLTNFMFMRFLSRVMKTADTR